MSNGTSLSFLVYMIYNESIWKCKGEESGYMEKTMEKIRTIPDFPAILASEMGHCILSHHGELEYGSPKKPAIAEAVALSMADNLDAKLETLRECFEAKDSNDWLGFNRWLDSNIRRTSL